MSSKRSLFGGALLAAGLTAPAANAQVFQIGYTAAHSYASAPPSVYAAYQYGTGPFVLNPTASNNYGDYANANMNFGSGGLSGSVTANSSFGYTFAHSQTVFGEFTVDQDFTASVNWDFSQAVGFYTNYLDIVDVNSGNVFHAESFSSGSQQLPLSANTTYQIYGLVDVGLFGGSATSWWNMTPVPAPGSAAMLGFAGFMAVRRRR